MLCIHTFSGRFCFRLHRMAPAVPTFYNHKTRTIVSHQISSTVASEITGQSSLQWLSRSAPLLSSTLEDDRTAAKFYANYPEPLHHDLDDVIPPLPTFDETTTAHFLQAGLPGLTVKHVPNRYPNSVCFSLTLCITCAEQCKRNKMCLSLRGKLNAPSILTN